MRILARHINPVRTAVREAVMTSRRRERGLAGSMLGAQHTSGGFCTTTLQGVTTSKKWLAGDNLGSFRPY